jgi:guanine nucleotide exchange factor
MLPKILKPSPSTKPHDAEDAESKPTPATQQPHFYWQLNDMMAFENVAFSHTVPGTPGSKYLACADCELGPIGYTGSDRKIFCIAVDRVAYTVV